MLVCLFKSCNLTTSLPAYKPELMYASIILFDYLNTIVILCAIYLCLIKLQYIDAVITAVEDGFECSKGIYAEYYHSVNVFLSVKEAS